jgi:hypothetical protein
MRSSLLLLMLSAGASLAQQTAAPAGTSPEWDVKANMTSLAEDVRRLEPVLVQVQPSGWVEKGAPGTYIKQLQSSKASLQQLIAATDALAQNPDRLTSAIDALFRLERMELLLGSLKEGARKYQSPEIADQLTVLIAQNSIHRDRLRQHISDLAAAREQEIRLMDQEAQRCRSMLSRQAPEVKTEPGKNRKQERK